jgi:hypothetical protein
MASEDRPNPLRVLVQNNKLPTVTAAELVNSWQAGSLARRRSLKTYFIEHFETLIHSPTHDAQSGESVKPVIYEGLAQTLKASHRFYFVGKSTEYRAQRLGEFAVAVEGSAPVPSWHTMIPDAPAREKAASDLVEAGLTPHFCLVYKTVVNRSLTGRPGKNRPRTRPNCVFVWGGGFICGCWNFAQMKTPSFPI